MLLLLAIIFLPVSFALVLDILIFSDYFANPAYLPVPSCKEFVQVCFDHQLSSSAFFILGFSLPEQYPDQFYITIFFSLFLAVTFFCSLYVYYPLLNLHPFSLRIQALFNLCELLSICFYYLPTTSSFSLPTAMLTVSKILVWMCIWPFAFLFPCYLLLQRLSLRLYTYIVFPLDSNTVFFDVYLSWVINCYQLTEF